MELILEVVSSQHYMLGVCASHRFLAAGGVIGRSSGCDWVIPDQARRLSGRHAVISFEDGQFHVTDISTNGVCLNGTKPLPKNLAVPLQDGDRLLMGDYQIGVKVHLAQPAVAPQAVMATDDPQRTLFEHPVKAAQPAVAASENLLPTDIPLTPEPVSLQRALAAFAEGLGIRLEDVLESGGEVFMKQAGLFLRPFLSADRRSFLSSEVVARLGKNVVGRGAAQEGDAAFASQFGEAFAKAYAERMRQQKPGNEQGGES